MLSAFEEYSHIEVEYQISPRLRYFLQQMTIYILTMRGD